MDTVAIVFAVVVVAALLVASGWVSREPPAEPSMRGLSRHERRVLARKVRRHG